MFLPALPSQLAMVWPSDTTTTRFMIQTGLLPGLEVGAFRKSTGVFAPGAVPSAS